MAHRRGSVLLVAPLLALTLFLVGCPKRPATTVASAPPPAAPAAPGGPSAPGTPSAPSAVSPPSVTTPAPAPGPSMTPPTAAPPTTPRTPTTPPKPSEFVVSDNLRDVHFDFDKYNIRPGDAKVLDANAAWLKTNARNLVLIEGHCDERGTAEYNLALGERRAKSTMNYLVAQGVAANRITIISYGKERPLCTDKNETCWAKNRRAHHLVKAQ